MVVPRQSCQFYIYNFQSIPYTLSNSEHSDTVRSQDKINKVLIICFFWILFCMIGSLIVLHQMAIVANEVDFGGENQIDYDLDAAWSTFWIVICLIMPILALGGNIIQWKIYRDWLLKGGSIVSEKTKLPPTLLQREEWYHDNNGGFAAF